MQSAIYNLQQAEDAIGSGGLFGSGIGHGAQTNLGLRARAADRLHLHRGGRAARASSVPSASCPSSASSPGGCCTRPCVARDTFGRLICAGLFAFIAFSVFQNAGMTMGIMPITGIPLPFVSYGGTAVLVFFGAVGLALSVGARRRHR